MKSYRIAAAFSAVALVSANVSAQQSPAPRSSAATATILPQVDGNGVFDLKLGQSIDLTDRKVLLSFPNESSNNANSLQDSHIISFKINGTLNTAGQGKRINLKELYETKKQFADMSECFMDFIDVVTPKGAPPVATFRLSCR